ncbi:MAG TPA: hypothetical protein VGB61_09960 [Pyrinomonadaceae bacterium]|jgi:hypothetical protein
MADENRGDNGTGGQGNGGGGDSSSGGSEKQSGDPGRTPGTAEGDEETVDESLRQKES